MVQKIEFLTLLLFIGVLTYGQQEKILVTQTTVKVNTMSSEELYFGFKEGDKIVLNFELVKGKTLKEIEIFEYPNTSISMEYKTKKIKNKVIQVKNKGIYMFKFKNSAVGSRICKVKIERIPANFEKEKFNPTVYWKTVRDTTYYVAQENYIDTQYIPRTVVPTTSYYVNSGSNATFKGGKSRTVFPVNLPENTVEWYYQFSATRDKAEIKRTKSAFDLVGQLTKLIDNTGTLEFGVNAFIQPPGANYCDFYLLDQENISLFEAKAKYSYFASGTRKNIKSGLVKVPGGASQMLYIGIKNPDSMYGIHVAIEVVAVVRNEEWKVRDVQKIKVKVWEEPYLQIASN